MDRSGTISFSSILAPFMMMRLPAFIIFIVLLSQCMSYERVMAYRSTSHAIPVTYWSHNLVQPHPTTTALPPHTYPSSSSRMRTALHAGKQPFNPFSQRSRNTRVKWFEADLDAFYTFVENQQLLTAEQELTYGKALRMWIQVEQIRKTMKEKLSLHDPGNFNPSVHDPAHLDPTDLNPGDHINETRTIEAVVTDEQLANAIGCSTVTLLKMSKFADISKTRLVNSNLKLVLAIVSRYRTAGIPNAELIAEGTRGLSKAALRYDYSKGMSPATGSLTQVLIFPPKHVLISTVFYEFAPST